MCHFLASAVMTAAHYLCSLIFARRTAISSQGRVLTSTYATSLALLQRRLGLKPGHAIPSVFFSTYLLIFQSLIEINLQNQNHPTAYDIHHVISRNQLPEPFTLSSTLKTSQLTVLFLLYSILKNDSQNHS